MRLHPLKALWPILGLLCAVPAFAGLFPSADRSSVPSLLILVGHSALGVDRGYPFKIVVRDDNGLPCYRLTVQLEFSDTDFSICTDQGDPGVSVDCFSHRTVSAVTDQNSEVTFYILGRARTGGAPGPGGHVKVYADGFRLNDVEHVAALDLDGSSGVDGNDYAALLADIFSGQMFARSDYDGDGSLGGNDFSIWLAAFFSGASYLGCGTAVCP